MSARCETCRYWSQMVAEAGGGIPGVRALCLSETGPKRQKMTNERDTCEAWAENLYGSVDEPPDYGERVRALYATHAEITSND